MIGKFEIWYIYSYQFFGKVKYGINLFILLKDTRNKGQIHLTTLQRTNSVVPLVPWQYNFTSLRSKPLYNSKIVPKIFAAKTSII